MKVFQSLGIVHRDLKPQNLLLCHSSTCMPTPTELTLKIGQNSAFLGELEIACRSYSGSDIMMTEYILPAMFFCLGSPVVCWRHYVFSLSVLLCMCTCVPRWRHSVTDLPYTSLHNAPCSRQITMPAPHHSVFYRPDALPAAQPTASKH